MIAIVHVVIERVKGKGVSHRPSVTEERGVFTSCC